MNTILLQIKSDSTIVTNVLPTDSSNLNIWFWLSIIELIIIIILFLKLRRGKENLTFADLNKENLKKSKEATIDFGNVMNSINGSGELYKELSRKCHPDRFVDSPLQKLAEEIFQEISKNKRDFEKLSALKERAINELNLTF
jgi:hypothetical protein